MVRKRNKFIEERVVSNGYNRNYLEYMIRKKNLTLRELMKYHHLKIRLVIYKSFQFIPVQKTLGKCSKIWIIRKQQI